MDKWLSERVEEQTVVEEGGRFVSHLHHNENLEKTPHICFYPTELHRELNP